MLCDASNAIFDFNFNYSQSFDFVPKDVEYNAKYLWAIFISFLFSRLSHSISLCGKECPGHSLKIHLLCCTEERKSYGFRTACVRVNND